MTDFIVKDSKEIELTDQQDNILQQQPQNQNLKVYNLKRIEGFKKFKLHVKLLLQKNVIVISRNLQSYLFLFLSPLLVVLLLQFWQYTADGLTRFEPIIDDIILQNKHLNKCNPGLDNPNDCVTIGYAIVGPREVWIDYVMKYVAVTNGLEFNKDVQFLVSGTPKDFNKYLQENKNKTQIGVIFCTSAWPVYEDLNISLPCTFQDLNQQKLLFYSIVWNWTLTWKSPYLQDLKTHYPKDKDIIRLKTSIDNAIFQFFHKYQNISIGSTVINKQSDLEQMLNQFDNSENIDSQQQEQFKERLFVKYQDYPKSPNRFLEGYDMGSYNGAIYFFIPYMIQFIIVINEILREKEKMLRQGITVVGMTHASFWISWVITSQAITFIIVSVQIISCYIFNVMVVTKTPVIITFVFYFCFGLSIQSIAYLITTFCQNVKTGYTVAYDIFTIIVRKVFNFYPAFHYSKIFGDIAYQSGKYFDFDEGRWKEGPGYKYSDLTQANEGKYVMPHGIKYYHAPNTIESFAYLWLNIFFFLVLTWYFDHVFPGNRGTAENALFFLSNDYWKCLNKKKKRKTSNDSQGIKFNYDQPDKVDTIQLETERVLNNKMKNAPVSGIRILRLGKTYTRYPFGIKSKKDVVALRDVYLEINQGELLAILGHNGAGKSTLINVLTGIQQPSTGTAEILEYDIKQQIDQIRSIIGVCPQFDILWDELTAYEHLKMYCILKGVQEELIDQEIDQQLGTFELLQYKHARISTLSGGQKRRISLSISFIGDPAIIFMDEPTTGMDPKTKRGVWKLIKELKKNRVIILTTHGMDEADALSDRIAVISEGKFECIGTSLYLKNNYGDGYRLTLIIEIENSYFIKSMIKQIIPSSNVLDDSGGSLIISIPVINQLELKPFFSIMENQIDNAEYLKFKNMIRDWGLSHATLEEVFMKITKKNLKYFS